MFESFTSFTSREICKRRSASDGNFFTGIRDKPTRTEMINAILSGNIVSAQRLIENQEALGVVDHNGRSYLHLSAYFDKVEITQLLIKSGLKVDLRDNYYLTPLHTACLKDASKAARLLIERGADLCARDKNWRTPLHVCAIVNSTECLNLLNRNPASINMCDQYGSTALHYAAAKGYSQLIENLLSNGSDPELADNDGRTCLHYSILSSDFRTIQIILEQDIDVNAKDCQGLTALHLACFESSIECVKLLVERGANVNVIDNDGNNPLHHSCFDNDYGNRFSRIPSNERDEVREFLIAKGADLKCKNNLLLTPLHMIDSEGAITNAYRRLNFDFDCRDYLGRTPLHIACFKGFEHLIKLFINNGADKCARDKFNRTPLHYAVEYLKSRCVETLIKIDSNLISLADDNGCTPLHYAARLSSHEAWFKLIDIYSNFNLKDNFGRTVHFYGAHSKRLLKSCLPLPSSLDSYNRNLLFYTLTSDCNISSSECLEFLLSIQNLKFDINQRDVYGRTPLHYAYLLKLDLHIECLLKNYASLYVEDENGLTPIHYLILTDHSEALITLLLASLIDLNQNRYKVCLLQCAAYYGANLCLKILIGNNYKHHSSLTKSLECAIWNNHVDCLETLLSQMVRTNTIKDLYKSYALHIGALKSDYACFNRLIVNLEKCDVRDEEGRTTMMFALVNCKEKNYCVESLLSRADCDLNALDNEHRNVLFYSVCNGNLEMVRFFLQSGVNALQKCLSGKTVVHLSALLGNTSIFSLLIDYLKQNNVPYDQLLDNNGFNPLHYACFKGNVEIVRLIISLFPEKDHPVDSIDKVNYLHLAAYSNEEECIRLILGQFGTEIINRIDSKGRNALHYLCMSKVPIGSVNQSSQQFDASTSKAEDSLSADQFEINQKRLAVYKILIANQVDINCMDIYRKTPLMIALQNDGCRLSLCLIDEPTIHLQIQDQNGCTALHYACRFKNELAGQKLSRKDSSLVNVADRNGRTPLHISSSSGLFDLTKSLLFTGASCFIQDTDNFTPALACAKNNDVADCLDLIIEVMIFEKSQNDANISSLAEKDSIRCSSPILETRKSLISQRSRRSELNSSFEDDLPRQFRKS